jgi:hypothetical protein
MHEKADMSGQCSSCVCGRAWACEGQNAGTNPAVLPHDKIGSSVRMKNCWEMNEAGSGGSFFVGTFEMRLNRLWGADPDPYQIRLCYSFLNPRRRGRVRAERAMTRLTFGAPLGLEMGLLGAKPQDLEWNECLNVASNRQNQRLESETGETKSSAITRNTMFDRGPSSIFVSYFPFF